MTRPRGPIRTPYAGLTFRSRIEAKWAVMFDKLDWKWEYEPLDLDGYIPDFVLQFHEPLLVEVKAELSLRELNAHTDKVERSGWQHEALIVGASPALKTLHPFEARSPGDSFGLLGERPHDLGDDGEDIQREWDTAVLFHCGICERTSLRSAGGSFQCRLNGCASHGGDSHDFPIDFDLDAMWRSVHDRTAWKAA